MEPPPAPPRACRIQVGGEPGFDPTAPYDTLLRMGVWGLGQHAGRNEWSIRLANIPLYLDQPRLLQHAAENGVFYCHDVHFPPARPGVPPHAYMRFYNYYDARDAIAALRAAPLQGGLIPDIMWATAREPLAAQVRGPPAPPAGDPPGYRPLALPPPPPPGPPPADRGGPPGPAAGALRQAPPPPVPYKAPPPPPPPPDRGAARAPPSDGSDSAEAELDPDGNPWPELGPAWQDGRPGQWCRQCECPPSANGVIWAADVLAFGWGGLSPTNRQGLPDQLAACATQVPICTPCYGALHILRRAVNRYRDPHRPRDPDGDLVWHDRLWHALNGLPPQA